jgi:hypothetical protein
MYLSIFTTSIKEMDKSSNSSEYYIRIHDKNKKLCVGIAIKKH